MNVAFAISVARPLTLQELAVKADIPDRQVRANNKLMQRSNQHSYSNTSSARARSAGGTSIPSALAVLRLMPRSSFTER